MRRCLSWLAAAALAVGLAGYASTGGANVPCEKCDSGYVYLGKRSEPKKWCNTSGDKPTCCIKDGKILDCTKNPAECPECAKNAGK
jgi:hypothetical protein